MGFFAADLEAEEVIGPLVKRIEKLEGIVEKIGNVLISHTNNNSIHRSSMYGGNPYYGFIERNEKLLKELGFIV